MQINSVSSHNSNQSFGTAYFAKVAHAEFNKAQKAMINTIAKNLSADYFYKYAPDLPAYVRVFDEIGQARDAIYFLAQPATQKGKKGINIRTLYCIGDSGNTNDMSWYKTGLETFIPDKSKKIMSKFSALLKATQKNLNKITDVCPSTPTVKITKKPIELTSSR